ncbi:unnamed protein product [Parnassius mnemosyne]|uniref:DDE-1 domain-containing protein n=1 Tax=Parnassius mnemosyne TaxID=213953 RepID=A0AAV1KP26_9NEOP
MLHLAVENVKENRMSSRTAEKTFGIPRRTILNKVKECHNKNVGTPTRLSFQEEKSIDQALIAAGEYGCPLTKLDLRLTVFEYLKKNNREILFHGKPPGKDWVTSFLDRHAGELSVRSTQNIKTARAQKSAKDFLEYFQNLEETIRDVPPSNILNLDETNLNDDPGSSKCIFRRGVKYPERVLNSSKGAISLMFSAAANGTSLSPYVVYKADNLYSEWIQGGPRGARYNRTSSGWFDSTIFEDYFKNVVLTWAGSLSGKKVVICDNLSSHLSLGVIELCQDHNISFVFIPPNSTHLTRPLDVAFFAPLKKAWRKILLQYKMENPNQTAINKNHFPKLLTQLIKTIEMNEVQNIKSGFRATGIYPFNPREVLKKIPECAEEMGNTHNIDSALLEYLKTTRQSKPLTSNRNRKVVVEPGKSVTVDDIQNRTKDTKKRSAKNKSAVIRSTAVQTAKNQK